MQKHRRRKEEERTRLLSIEFANMLTSTKSFFPSIIYSGKALCVVERRRSRCLGAVAAGCRVHAVSRKPNSEAVNGNVYQAFYVN